MALGASRRRLLQEALIESIILIVGAVAVAWLFTGPLLRLVITVLPEEVALGQHLMPDYRTVVFLATLVAVAISVLTLVPLGVLGSRSVVALLRPTGASVATGRRFRSGLLVGQLAITATLVYVTGLSYQSTRRLANADIGFEPRGLLTVRLPVYDSQLVKGSTADRLAAESVHRDRTVASMERLNSIDSIQLVSRSTWPPLESGGPAPTPLVIDGVVGEETPPLAIWPVGRDYFEVLRQPLVNGHSPSEQDIREGGQSGVLPAIVTRSVAADLERRRPGLGHILSHRGSINRRYRVVGVVGDHHIRGAHRQPDPAIFAFLPEGIGPQFLLVRASPGREAQAAAAMRVSLTDIWGLRAPRDIRDGQQLIDESTALYDTRFVLLGVTAATSLILLCAGVSGAVAFQIRSRAREFAIRLALGATPTQLRAGLLTSTLLLGAGSLLLGIGAGIMVARVGSVYLFGVAVLDVTSIVATALALAGVATLTVVSASRPIKQAAPMSMLRHS
jgi:hypothetical protein